MQLLDYAALFSALFAMTTPTHAAHHQVDRDRGWATADTSIYANAFFPRRSRSVSRHRHLDLQRVHNVAFLGGATRRRSRSGGDKMYWNP